MDFEGAHGVLIVGGYKDDGHVGANQFQDIEAGQFRHLHVEENQIRLVFGNSFYGFHSVDALGCDFDLWMRLQILANDMARELFVIDDERLPFFVRRGAHAFSSLSAGRSRLT